MLLHVLFQSLFFIIFSYFCPTFSRFSILLLSYFFYKRLDSLHTSLIDRGVYTNVCACISIYCHSSVNRAQSILFPEYEIVMDEEYIEQEVDDAAIDERDESKVFNNNNSI